MKSLIKQYSDIFTSTLYDEPSNLPPIPLIVDVEKWKVPRNARGSRLKSINKEEEIKKQVYLLLNNHRIVPCMEPCYIESI